MAFAQFYGGGILLEPRKPNLRNFTELLQDSIGLVLVTLIENVICNHSPKGYSAGSEYFEVWFLVPSGRYLL